ncbi:hypothetical protein PHYSODRAFT_304006 [Phytophthora sojae]|uniref:Uncharacterized protein n=1 Tax=Phytophthora sojae (strain P6497) TaxID=1094619 RepID=G4ZW51_PHYSP|nr:hypothetical protein PHYSODRAFT_304006 [Phytophthora sojae]EGZ12333.1 hypothetical protein PHYSODRAFT_304006 [Phytophthora sojae]|eukprot:XP_009532666.1 hypothetical protein PHYSODRAFT_304006 [Phytophthora sojae]
MQLRRPERAGVTASLSGPRAPLWTQLDASAPQDARAEPHNAAFSPAARSGHAMTLLPPTGSVLLFGGADGQIFFEDVFLLEPAGYAGSSSTRSTRAARRGSVRGEDAPGQAVDVQWKRLVVSRGTSFNGQSPRSPMFSSAGAIGSGVERRAPSFLHAGGGRDYHSMHYVQTSAAEERAKGVRVLVIGNVVVASDEVAAQGGADTQAEGGAGAFDAPTLRVEELRVRQPLLEAQWEVRRVDDSSMWKPRARHAHSSVVVGGEQVFVFGGKDASSSTFFNDIFYYDAPLNQWVKPTVNPTGQLPQPRAFAGLTASDDGNTLFLFGGTDGKQEFGSLFLYDVANSRWDSLAGATLGDRPSCRINHSLTFAAPNHLVLFGGRRRALRQNELYIYNVNTRAWRLVQGGPAEGQRSSRRRSSQTALDDNPPTVRTAHATVMFRPEPAGPEAVQKLLVFGGYAGSHQWLDDLHLLSLPQAVLMQPPPPSRNSSRSIAATQRTRPARSSFNKSSAAARLALSAPQQPVQMSQSSQSARLPPEATQSEGQLERPAPPVQEPPPVSQTTQPLQEPPPETVESDNRPDTANAEQSSSLPPQNSLTSITPASSPPRQPPREISRSDTLQRPTTTFTGSGVLTDITNQSSSNTQKQQQQPALPRSSGTATTGGDAASPGAVKKHKRRRLVEDSQDSSNSNSVGSSGSGELTTAQVGIQTTLLQLLQHQPRVEDTLARILSMLTREQTARQQQNMSQETLMRIHSEEQSKRLEAANRRNEALEGRLARCEAERVSLQEKLMARETELYMHKRSLEASIPPLNERIQAIEASHMQQLNVSRVIESKISAVHDFMDELRNAGVEGTERDDSPLRRQGARIPFKDRYGSYILTDDCEERSNNKCVLDAVSRLDDSVATQPTPSPPKPLLYPQRVVLALEEKIRVIQSEKEALESQVKEMTEKLKRVEGREAQARQFLFSWCQGGNPPMPACKQGQLSPRL